jgi:hypothetical protein
MEHIEQIAKKRFEVRSSKPCEFCQQLDPQFPRRHPLDQAIGANRKTSSASAHLTEDGYVRHRILELNQRVSRLPRTAA